MTTKLFKYFLLSIIIIIASQSCKDTTKRISEKQDMPIAYSLKGEAFSPENALTNKEAATVFSQLSTKDSTEITLKTTVAKVCKAKGCWMTINLPNSEPVRVTFKNYGFFVPKDIEGQTVVLHGKAFKEEVAVETLRHYAEDEGASKDDILAITKPETSYSIIADGVLVKK